MNVRFSIGVHVVELDVLMSKGRVTVSDTHGGKIIESSPETIQNDILDRITSVYNSLTKSDDGLHKFLNASDFSNGLEPIKSWLVGSIHAPLLKCTRVADDELQIDLHEPIGGVERIRLVRAGVFFIKMYLNDTSTAVYTGNKPRALHAELIKHLTTLECENV